MARSQAQPVEVTMADDGSQTIDVLPASSTNSAVAVGVSRSGSAQTVLVRAAD